MPGALHLAGCRALGEGRHEALAGHVSTFMLRTVDGVGNLMDGGGLHWSVHVRIAPSLPALDVHSHPLQPWTSIRTSSSPGHRPVVPL